MSIKTYQKEIRGVNVFFSHIDDKVAFYFIHKDKPYGNYITVIKGNTDSDYMSENLKILEQNANEVIEKIDEII